MSDVFTRYIRALEPGREADPELFDAFWAKLKTFLKRELRRRNLWDAPPSYLGISSPSWLDPEALDDLTTDAYLDILKHLNGLKAQLQNHDNIDGYVILCIRHFVQKKQQSRDPLGYRVFEILQIAIRSLCEDRALLVVAGDLRIGNDTLLSFQGSIDPKPAGEAELTELTEEWIDGLLPELITAWRKSEPAKALAERIPWLAERGVRTFRFRNLVSPMKRQIRERWRALQLLPELGFSEALQPSPDFEQRDRYESLSRCVETFLEGFEGRRKTYEYLAKLWTFSRFLASETDSGQMPPQREVSRQLKIPRERISELMSTLGEWVKRCLEASAGGRQEGSSAPATT